MNSKKLIITETDVKETSDIAALVSKMDMIDPDHVNRVSDEIFKQQPFYLSLLLGYHNDVSMEELEELSRIHFLVWEYFSPKVNLRKKKVTQAEYEEAQRRNIRMLQYSEGESNDSRNRIYTDELQNLKSKALWTAVLLRYNTRPALMNMNEQDRGMTLIAILTFIQCFEKLS